MKELTVVCIIFGIQPSSTVRAFGRENVARDNFVQWTTINLKREIGFLRNKRNFRFIRALIRPTLIPINLFFSIKKLYSADIVYVIKYPPLWLSMALDRICSVLIYDFDDPMWLDDFGGERKFNCQLRFYDGFTCDNEIQLSRGKQLSPVGRVINGALPNFKRVVPVIRNKVNLIWVGSQSTRMYLESIEDVLIRILESRDFVTLTILGLDESNGFMNGDRIRYVPHYDERRMVIELCNSDIGLFPVLNDELSDARGVHKANIYLAAGIPVIASSSSLIEHTLSNGLSGIICESSEDWYFSILGLLDNELLLFNMKNYIMSEYKAEKNNLNSTLELLKFFGEVINSTKSK